MHGEYTAQQKALEQARQLYGMTAFTENHCHIRMVGYKVGHKTIVAGAETWEEAHELLAGKA